MALDNIRTKEWADRVRKFVEDLQNEKLVRKYVYKNTWISGSSTTVYPFSINDREITMQWNSNKKIFNRFIRRIVKENSDLISDGYFWKSDGSCPSTVTFYFR